MLYLQLKYIHLSRFIHYLWYNYKYLFYQIKTLKTKKIIKSPLQG